MQFVFEEGADRRDVEVVVHDPDAVIADLAGALRLDGRPGSGVCVDGRDVPGDRRLDRAGITDGSVVRIDAPGTGPPDPDSAATPVVVVDLVGGLDAGRRTRLAPGRWSIGRSGADVAIDDTTVSETHAWLDVTPDAGVHLTDNRSFNGSWVNGVPAQGPVAVPPGALVRLGASQLQIGPLVGEDRPAGVSSGRRFTSGSTVPFNRPPHAAPPSDHEPVDPPQPAAETATTSAVGLISVIAPLVLGLVMVKVFHNWLYGMFALLSPVMLIGNAVESRRRDHKTRRRDRARFARDLAVFRTRLAALAALEHDRRVARLPPPSEILRRATQPSTRLWERRGHHDDAMVLRAGIGTVPWNPPVEGLRRAMAPEVRQVVTAASRLPATPVEVDLSGGGVAGIIGPRPAALALARSLVAQAVTLQGPADVAVVVLATIDRAPDWDWTKWLPHTRHTSSGRRALAADPQAADQLLRDLLAEAPKDETRHDVGDPRAEPSGPTLLVILDDESLTEGRRSPARSVLRGLAGPVGGVVLAASEDRLPAMCTTVVEVTSEFGEATVHSTKNGEQIRDVLVGGMAEPTARTLARALARLDDPELDAAGAGLPSEVGLLPLLGLDPPLVDTILERWRAAGPDPDLVAPIGVGQDGVLVLDLVADGPHGLVAGTTGSGKSELLRSLVVGLAAGCSPAQLTFVLIDFKGGSAFDDCARLPHTVGMVTDLDERLGARALRCLEAELRHRERTLRAAGVEDLRAYRRLPPRPVGQGQRAAMPRLVVVIDEFATLKNELPDFVDALVGVAQRGRSLGVHLVLATQRPSGAVSEHIRANTNLRIALRMQDAGDSQDVIDVADAASIGRNQPGRALVRLGPGEVVMIQTALSSGTRVTGTAAPVEVRPFRFGRSPMSPAGGSSADPPGSPGIGLRPTDLSRLVDALGSAFIATRQAPPRRPWPEPLAGPISLESLVDDRPAPRFGAPGALVAFAMADRPDQQVQEPTGWCPTDGNLLLVGAGGSGTTTALSSIALAAARCTGPDDLHLFVLDFGAGELGPIAGLPHTGAVITTDERERQVRLMRHLKSELSRRRARPDPRATEPRIVVLLDGIGGFRAAWNESDPAGVFDDLTRVFADGPELGVHIALSADRPGAVPNAMSGLAGQRVIFRLGERLDYGLFGLSTCDVPDLSPGGAVIAGSATEIMIGRPTPTLEAAVTELAGTWGAATSRPPARIRALPSVVDVSDLVPAARLGPSTWFVPVGIGDAALDPVGLTLYAGEHGLIAGPPRSGRTTTLLTIAAVVRASPSPPTIVGIAGARSALSTASEIDHVLAPDSPRQSFDEVADLAGPILMLVDDADLVADEHHGLQDLLDRRRPDVHVVAAGRSEALRSLYTHWTRAVRAARCGVLLQPDPDLDGDLLGARLPRRAPVPLSVGRGYLVHGSSVELIQVASESAVTD